MPHGTGIGPLGQIPPSGEGHSLTIWHPAPAAFPLVESAIPPADSGSVGLKGCQAVSGGPLFLLLPKFGTPLTVQQKAYISSNTDHTTHKWPQVAKTMSIDMNGSFTESHADNWPHRSWYLGSTGVYIPSVPNTDGCFVWGTGLASGSIGVYGDHGGGFIAPADNPMNLLVASQTDIFNVASYVSVVGSGFGDVTPGVYNGGGSGIMTVWTGGVHTPNDTISLDTPSWFPMHGGFLGFVVDSDLVIFPFTEHNGTASAVFHLDFMWYRLVDWPSTTAPSITDPSLSSVKASSRGGCC